jgi:uncharacterized membrane protein
VGATSSAVMVARNRRAALKRHREPNDPDVLAADAELRAASLAAHIARAVDAFPPLNAEQRERLAVLLRGPAAA